MIDYSYVRDNSVWDLLGIDRNCNEVLYFDKWFNHYHTSEHTNAVMEYLTVRCKRIVHHEMYEMAIVAAFFHDIGYDPSDPDPVGTALIIFDSLVKNRECKQYHVIRTAIAQTRYNNLILSDLGKLLARADCQDIISLDYPRLALNSKLLLKEYQHHSFLEFVEGNKDVLDHVGDAMMMRSKFQQAIKFNTAFYNTHPFNFGIYAGTFNPFHKGHESVLMKSYPLFDKIIIATPKVTGRVFQHPSEVLGKRFEVVEFDGLFTDFVNRYIQIYPNVRFTIIRGVRHGIDLQYEQDLQRYYRQLGLPKNIEIIYISTDPGLAHVSGTSIREIAKASQEKVQQYIVDKI